MSVDEITKRLVDNGKLIEAGWVGLEHVLKLKDSPPQQSMEMRRVFFSGASHVFFSILSFLEPGQEATERDCERINKLNDELLAFQQEMEALVKGSN